VDMHPRNGLLHRAAQFQVGLAGIVGMDAALHADFGRAAIPCLGRTPRDFGEIEIVRDASQRLMGLALGEGAEAAFIAADIGVVDVAVDGIGDDVAVDLGAQAVGRIGHELEVDAAGAEQGDDLLLVQSDAGGGLGDQVDDDRVGALVGSSLRGGNRFDQEARRPLVVAAPAMRIRRLQDARHQCRVLPAGVVVVIGWIDRQAGGQDLAGVRGFAAQSLQMRPGRLGVHVVERDRGNAAPVVDPSLDQNAVFAGGQVWRGLDVHLGAKQNAGDGDGPQKFVEVGLGGLGHPRARLGAEVLDDDFLDVAVLPMQVAQRQDRLDPLFPRLANTDQDAGGERNLLFAGKPDGFQPPGWILVR